MSEEVMPAERSSFKRSGENNVAPCRTCEDSGCPGAWEMSYKIMPCNCPYERHIHENCLERKIAENYNRVVRSEIPPYLSYKCSKCRNEILFLDNFKWCFCCPKKTSNVVFSIFFLITGIIIGLGLPVILIVLDKENLISDLLWAIILASLIGLTVVVVSVKMLFHSLTCKFFKKSEVHFQKTKQRLNASIELIGK